MCCLTPSTTAKEDFVSAIGDEVTVGVKAAAGAKVKILHIRYAGSEVDAEPPYQFKVKAGAMMLVVLVEASKAGVLVQLVETCEDGEQVIDRFHFDPMNPARGYIVRGL
jgi:hypothetical protein